MDYDLQNGDSRIQLEYDNRLRVNYSEVTQAGSVSNYILRADFGYEADGRVAEKDDLLDNKWDRTNKFDFAGRVTFNQFGMSGSKRIYEQDVAYDAFSQVTERDTIYWDVNNPSFNSAYTNGRKIGVKAPDYDAAGNIIYTETGNAGNSEQQWTTFDAAGRQIASRDRWRVATAAHQEDETGYVFDGDGRPVIEKSGMRFIMGLNPDPMVIYTEGFQVWSSVLGSSLTTVDTAGNKRETKVFAGGALIARQDAGGPASTGDDRILFTTADPVTGTKATFDYTNATSNAVREDTEPVGGQQIERNDPGTGYPTDYGSQVLGFVRDPEWQCVTAGLREHGFRDMPVHCQKAMLESKSFSIVADLGLTVSEESPKKIKLVDPPMPTIPGTGGEGSPTALILARSMRATYKPSGDDGCDWDDDGPRCSVQSEPWTDPTDAISAENDTPSRRLEGWEVLQLRHNLSNYLTQSCKDFVSGLITRAAAVSGGEIRKTDMLALFDEVARTKGIEGYLARSNSHATGPLNLAISNYRETFYGLDAEGRAIWTPMSDGEYNTLSGSSKKQADLHSFLIFSTSVAGAKSTLHELIHLAVRGGTEVSAAVAALGPEGYRFVPPSDATAVEIGNAASNIFDDRLAKNCGGTRRTLPKRDLEFIR